MILNWEISGLHQVIFSISSLQSEYKYSAVFGRINYNWEDEYILDFTARRDGSSRFGPCKSISQFLTTAGGAWIFTQANFIRDQLTFLSFGEKIRGSYGTTGNDQIGDYTYLNLYSPLTGLGVPYQGATSLTINGLSNPYLQWEETEKLSVGLDLGFFKDRILFNSTWFRNRSSNQLLSYALPVITGNTGILENFPATVQNKGWEFTLNTKNISNKNFSWTTTLTLTIPQNKLIAFPNLSTSTYANSLIIGQPVSISQVFRYSGVDPSTGVYLFADSSGKPTSSPNYLTDRTSLINTLPTFYGGFQNNFTYKGFHLDIFFQFVKQIKSSGLSFGSNQPPGTFNTNQPVTMLKRWQQPGDMTTIQRYNSDYSLYDQFNDAAYSSNAALFRWVARYA